MENIEKIRNTKVEILELLYMNDVIGAVKLAKTLGISIKFLTTHADVDNSNFTKYTKGMLDRYPQSNVEAVATILREMVR